MLPTTTSPVLIIGAGPTGLALATVLSVQGVPCRILEKETAFHHHSRGKGLQPRSLELLDKLGVVQGFLNHGLTDFPVRVFNHDHLLAELDLRAPKPRPDVPYPGLLLIQQWRTESLLREHLAPLGVTVELGRELLSFTDTGQGVTAEVRHTETGLVEEIQAAYLVGCDGGHSVVRHHLNVTFEGETLEQSFALGDVELDGLDPQYGYAWFNDDNSYVAAAPLPGESVWQVQASNPPDDSGQVAPASLELLQRYFDERTGSMQIRLHHPTWLSAYRVSQRLVNHYRVGRVFLAGDAAHIHSPAGGQGMNTGIQDAFNLGWKLACVFQGKADDALLDTYEAERLPIARGVLNKSGTGTMALFSPNPVIAFARDHLILPAVRHPKVMEALMLKVAQLDLNYRESALSVDASDTHSPRAGDRAPDAPTLDSRTGELTRLFDQFRGLSFVLLAFSSQQTEAAIQAKSGLGNQVKTCLIVQTEPESVDPAWNTVLLDPDGIAEKLYHAQANLLVLVRPDGYIGFRGTSAQVLSNYLMQWFTQPERELA